MWRQVVTAAQMGRCEPPSRTQQPGTGYELVGCPAKGHGRTRCDQHKLLHHSTNDTATLALLLGEFHLHPTSS